MSVQKEEKRANTCFFLYNNILTPYIKLHFAYNNNNHYERIYTINHIIIIFARCELKITRNSHKVDKHIFCTLLCLYYNNIEGEDSTIQKL